MPKRRRHRRKASSPVQPPIIQKITADLAREVNQYFAPQVELRADYKDPAQIAARMVAVVEKHLALPPAVKPIVAYVSDEALETTVVVERPITSTAVREMQKWVADNWLWSAKDMAQYLACDRSTIKRIESGSRQPNEKFTRLFHLLRRQRAAWLEERGARDRDTVVVESEKPLPRRWRVLRPIVKCSRCSNRFEQVNGRHKRCHTPECDANQRRGLRSRNNRRLVELAE